MQRVTREGELVLATARRGCTGKSPKRILVVDDEAVVRELVQWLLEDEGYHVLAVENGQVALSVVSTTTPNLILLDMGMPVMDGWAFAQAYAGLPGPHAPIVVCTAAVDAEQRAESIGAASFLRKPFKARELSYTVACYAV